MLITVLDPPLLVVVVYYHTRVLDHMSRVRLPDERTGLAPSTRKLLLYYCWPFRRFSGVLCHPNRKIYILKIPFQVEARGFT